MLKTSSVYFFVDHPISSSTRAITGTILSTFKNNNKNNYNNTNTNNTNTNNTNNNLENNNKSNNNNIININKENFHQWGQTQFVVWNWSIGIAQLAWIDPFRGQIGESESKERIGGWSQSNFGQSMAPQRRMAQKRRTILLSVSWVFFFLFVFCF